ncbi:MAG: hypothetical protein ABSH09_12265 [Bryobacteraceae bacterium]
MAQNVTLSPTALTFCVASTSSAAPAAQTVNVTTTNTQGVFFTTATTDSAWLHITPSSGTATSSTPGSLSVSITPSGLPSNTPPAQDVQVDVGGQETNVVVTVEVGQSGCVPTEGATLSASPTSIALTSSTTSASLTINGSGAVNYTASGGFFTINSSSATTGSITLPLSSALTIALSSSATTTSSYSGSITFSQGSSFVTVPVSYTGSGGGSGSFSVNSTSLNLSSGSQTLTVSGSGSVNVTSAPTGGSPGFWFTISGVSLDAGPITLPDSLTVSLTGGIDTSKDYSGTITLTQGSSVINVAVVYAGGSSLTTSPTSIALSSASTAETLTITGTGSVTLDADYGPSPNPSGWFSIVGYSGSSVPLSPNAQFTVAFNSNVASSSVSYSGGTIHIAQGNTTLSVPVSYTPTGGVMGTYSYSPTPTFNIATGATFVSPITVNISGFNGLVVSVLTQINNGPAGWLSAGDNSFESPTQVTVSVNNPSSFTGGQTYTGSVYIQESGVTLLTIPVTVNVGTASSTLTISPTSLSFSYQIGGTTPGSQAIDVSSPANTAILFTPAASTNSCGSGWLVVSPSSQTSTSGTSPVSVSVQINTAGLGSVSETCNGTVTISAPSATNATTNIPVSLLVSNTPLLQAAPASLTFTAQSVSSVPASQTVNLTSTGGALPFSYTVNPSSTGGTVFLTVSASTATTPSTLTAAINAAVFSTLTPGTYTNNIVLTSANAGNSPFTIPVTLTVGTSLNASPSAIVINYQVGELQPAAQTILVSSTGAPIQFTASVVNQTCSNLVQVTPTIGTTTQSLGQNGTNLTVETSNLSSFTNPTTCTAAIDIGTANSSTPVVVNVTVNIVNAAVIDVGVSEVVQAVNAILPSTQIATVPLTSSDDGLTRINFAATAATNPAGQTWLTVSPNSGSTPSNLQVTTNSTNLVPGIYTGSITVTSATNVPTETVPVTLIVASQATVSPTSLTFTLPQGASNPASQTITVGGVPTTTSVTAVPTTTSCGTGWLTATASGTTVTVGIVGAGLTVATCTGQVTVIVPGASNSPLNVPVTLMVTNAIALSLSSTSLTFNSNTGATTAPASQTVQLSAAGGAAVAYTAAVTTQSGGSWLTVSPTSGNTPATLTIGIAQSVLSGLSAGTYSGTVTVSSPNSANVTVSVSLVVAAVPPPLANSMVNSATQLPGAVSPGEIVTIYGTNLGPTPALGLTLTSSGTVETMLGTTQVFFDSTPAPLIYVGANQINAIVPYEVADRFQTTVTVSTNGLVSTGIVQSVVATAPGIFTANSSGKGPGAILNQDYSLNSASHPAAAGTIVSIYATGEGVLNPPVATGSVTSKNPPYPVPVASPVSVTFQVTTNGNTVNIPANVTYAGEAPELVSGALQVNVVIPTLVPSGAQTVILTIGANSSPAQVTVNVK